MLSVGRAYWEGRIYLVIWSVISIYLFIHSFILCRPDKVFGLGTKWLRTIYGVFTTGGSWHRFSQHLWQILQRHEQKFKIATIAAMIKMTQLDHIGTSEPLEYLSSRNSAQ